MGVKEIEIEKRGVKGWRGRGRGGAHIGPSDSEPFPFPPLSQRKLAPTPFLYPPPSPKGTWDRIGNDCIEEPTL